MRTVRSVSRTDAVSVRDQNDVLGRYRGGDGQLVDTLLDRLPVDEVLAGLPVREFRSYRGRRHYSSWYWSATTGGHVVYESRLELARILLADHDSGVVAIAAQPLLLEGWDGERIRRHVPDVLLGHADGAVTVVDVKAASRLDDPKVSAQFAWTKQLCDRWGFGFEVWSGTDPMLLENVRFLAGYRRPMVIAEELVPQVLEAAASPCTVADVERRLAGTGRSTAVVPPGGAASVVALPIGRGSVPLVGRRHDCAGGGGGVSTRTVTVAVGESLLWDGDVVRVVEFDGRSVVVRLADGHYSNVALAEFVSRARGLEPVESNGDPGLIMAGLPADERDLVAQRAGHVREVLTGYTSGHAGTARPGEPRPEYTDGVPLKARYRAKAAELSVGVRTIENWVAAYRAGGEPALVDERRRRGRSTVDPRWDAAVRAELAAGVLASTPTRGAVLMRVAARLEREHGLGVVPVPSQATACRRLAVLTKGTNAVSGSASGRRSIAERPQGVYGRLRATRPGEYLILDTQDLDVFAMEPVTCRWVKAQLTIAQDLFDRQILGLKVTPVSTKAVDVAGVLFEAVTGRGSGRPMLGPVHGLPERLVFTEAGGECGAAEPVWCPPETLVVDHGKAFLSAHVIGVCARLGISIQPAQPRKPTDKPTVERFFKSLREGLTPRPCS